MRRCNLRFFFIYLPLIMGALFVLDFFYKIAMGREFTDFATISKAVAGPVFVVWGWHNWWNARKSEE